ncbi:MAG: hypothetical protein LBH44_03890 [Treponema sp.]|jgi:hypothetical protein|nr:hypothetical protein [Treponema sp.]
MKNTFKLFGFAAMAAMIIFSPASCKGKDSGSSAASALAASVAAELGGDNIGTLIPAEPVASVSEAEKSTAQPVTVTPSGGDRRPELEGYWTKDGGNGGEEFYFFNGELGYEIEFKGAFDWPVGYMEVNAYIMSYDGSTVKAAGYDDEVHAFSARLSGKKLTLSGLEQLGNYYVSGFNGTYTKYE